jgi:hypothetical protein
MKRIGKPLRFGSGWLNFDTVHETTPSVWRRIRAFAPELERFTEADWTTH